MVTQTQREVTVFKVVPHSLSLNSEPRPCIRLFVRPPVKLLMFPCNLQTNRSSGSAQICGMDSKWDYWGLLKFCYGVSAYCRQTVDWIIVFTEILCTFVNRWSNRAAIWWANSYLNSPGVINFYHTPLNFHRLHASERSIGFGTNRWLD